MEPQYTRSQSLVDESAVVDPDAGTAPARPAVHTPTPPTFMPIDPSGGAQPILSGFTVIVQGMLVADRYRLSRTAGDVGEATRWDGVDERLSRHVLVYAFPTGEAAVPVLEAARLASGAMDARFLRILDAGQDADGAYIVCEGVEGESLGAVLRQGPLSDSAAAWLVSEVAAALSAVQPLHLYHLCLSPDNVFITGGGQIKISGLMVASALTATDVADLTVAEAERLDVTGCGRLLYACLTATWPGEATGGVPAAARTDAGFPSPLQVRPETAPTMNRLTYQMLSPSAPGHLDTLAQVVGALATQSHPGDAADLARRVSAVAAGDNVPRSDAVKRPVILHAGDDGAPAVPTQESATAESTPVAPVTAGVSTTPPPPASPGSPTEPEGGDDSVLLKRNARLTTRQVRRWSVGFLILIGLVVLALLTAVIVGLYHVATPPPPIPAPTPVPIVAGQVFDPEADGGNASENDDQVPRAFDGDPTTGWSTVTYGNATYIPDKKPGVGLVLDLGAVQAVTEVTIVVATAPTTVQVAIPMQNPATVTAPPMDTVASWHTLATTHVTATTVTIPLSATHTRFLLVYLTSLPQRPGSTTLWQESIMEVTVAG